MVQCKFKCIYKRDENGGAFVQLDPVTTGSRENEEFFHYTPYGKFEMGTINPDAADQFQVGKEYIITINETQTNFIDV
jgi:hypothetical protein